MSSVVAPLPTQLGGFEIIRRLGAGGMAEVFVAKRQGAEGTYKILVLKRILPAHGASRRFRSMFVGLARPRAVLNDTFPSSTSTQTTVECGVPSARRSVTTPTYGFSARNFRSFSFSVATSHLQLVSTCNGGSR